MDIRFQRILGCSLHFLEKGMDFQEFEERLWETMNSVGKDILRVVLEAKDEEIHQERDRNAFQVVRRSDQRTILTLFGDVTYRRTSYRKKNTGSTSTSSMTRLVSGRRKGLTPSWKPWFLRGPQSSLPRKREGTSFPKTRNAPSALRW